MNLVIFDPDPKRNSYLTIKFLDPLIKYCQDTGVTVSQIDSLNGVSGSAVLALSDYFTPEIIDRLKNSGNKLVAFDINDSSWLTNPRSAFNLDLIFKFSGIQKTRHSNEITINKNIDYGQWDRPFMSGDNEAMWNDYISVRDSGKLVSMPYPPYYHHDVEHVPFDQKNKHAVIRGGNHYLRFHLFLNLARVGLINGDSSFLTKDYYGAAMRDDFRYCPNCIKTFRDHGKISYAHYKERASWGCNNPYSTWTTEDIDENYEAGSSHKWNNRCVPMFYHLTEKFIETHGPVPMPLIENALNGYTASEETMYPIIARNLLYGDYKWVFSVDAPPRFWQAANAKSINILPRWTQNQIHFPEIVEGDHYLGFDPSFQDIDKLNSVTREQHDHITNNCFEMYNTWIKGTEYEISTNLLKHMMVNIRRIEGV